MFVINIKKMIKYLLVFIFFSILIFFAKSFLESLRDGRLITNVTSYIAIDQSQEEVSSSNTFFTRILDQSIPGIKEVNTAEPTITETTYAEATNPLQVLLRYELPIMASTFIESKTDVAETNIIVEETNTVVEHADTNVATEVLDSGVPATYTNDYNGVEIKNSTNYTLTDDILDYSTLDINKSDIMIFHTHTCESYTPTADYQYESSGTYRTIDLNYSVARAGSYLSEQLISYGYNVIHDKTYHDYPAYSGSYGRSQATIENLLISHPSTDVIIDLHRDAIADYTYAPSVKIGDEVVSQLMFVIGTDGGGLEHPNWQQNLKFAIAVQQKANELYPGLFRPIILRDSRYNQQLGKAACIIEVGATGNTLEQSISSMKYLALVLNEVLK